MEELKPVYLMFVGETGTDIGSNKYYNIFPKGDQLEVRYGRVGGHESVKMYSCSKYNSLIAQKTKKGYENISHLMTDVIEDSKVETNEESNNGQDKFSVIPILSIREVIKRLYDYANNLVTSSYKVSASVVTQAQVDEAQNCLDNIATNYKDWTLQEFNKELKTLFKILPRKMRTIKQYLASDMEEETIAKILDREQDTLTAMAGMVYQRKSSTEKCDSNTQNNTEKCVEISSILTEMGIEMEEVDEHEIEMLKQKMGDVKNRFFKAWRVCNQETEEAFRNFQNEHHLETKICCHGSRNTNWFNILKVGLRWKVANVITNGSMFGSKAIYFSNPDKEFGGVRKSIGYTSLSGSYWANGNDNCGFIAFYEVALGKSYDVYSFDSKYYNMDLNKLKQEDPEAWHLWAHGNTSMLRNDELVVYSTDQMTIRYLVEIR